MLGGREPQGLHCADVSEERDGAEALLGSNDTVMSPPGVPSAATGGPEALFAGRYQLLGRIGRGGMGTVYQARDTLVGDVVALKVLEVGERQGGELLERFRREVRLARRISHPSVARTHDLGEHAGRLFLTMEYVEGEDLQALLSRERPLAAARAARIALAVCEGLAAAHAAGVVHRDLKPANILVERTGRVVLTDFGIARALAGEASSRTQGMVGTPLYMAPEQISGAEVEARSDLYAAGLLLYEMLTGQPPFTGDAPLAVAFARLRQPPPDPGRYPGVPEALAALVLHCLAREPEERPSGAHEVAAALRGWLTSVGEQGELPPAHITPASGSALPSRVTPISAIGSPTPRTVSRPGEQGLAVLPLRFVGPSEQEFLAEALTEGLIDVLSRTRDLRVQSSGATARFHSERDPRVVGRELGVELVVDGTVQRLGSAVRTSLRLVEVATSVQLWSGRIEDSGEEVLALQDRLGHRMAEALRGELLLASYRSTVPPEVLALYRQAQVHVHRTLRILPGEILQPMEECIQRAPDFLPALGLHAIASLRLWFVRSTEDKQDWEKVARDSVARAVQRAPDLVDTLVAKGMLATQDGDWRGAVVALRIALDAAPTSAAALQYLGSLQCEAGRADEGLVRLRKAYDLEPEMGISLYEIARCSALRGDLEEYRSAVEQLARYPFLRLPAILLRLRVAAWSGDREALQECQAALREEPSRLSVNAEQYASLALGEIAADEALKGFEELLEGRVNTRFATMLCQLATEMLCMSGEPERALEYLRRAADMALIDLEWLDRCQVLAPLRRLPGFSEARLKVRTRVEAIWTA